MSLFKNAYGIYQLHEFIELFNPTHRKEEIRKSTGCKHLKDTFDKCGLPVIGAHTWRARYIRKLQEEDLARTTKHNKVRLYQNIRDYIDQDRSVRLPSTEDHEGILGGSGRI